MKATTGKSVIKAMLWLYEHRLDHVKGVLFQGPNKSRISAHIVVDSDGELSPTAANLQCACLAGCLLLIESTDDASCQAEDLLDKATRGHHGYVRWNDR